MSGDNGDLFKSFFNPERVLVRDMDSAQLRGHREELAKIAFEARARISACDEELREREAKLPTRDWIVPSNLPDPNVTNAINVVKSRSERMSKAEKLRKQLESAGISDDDIQALMVNVPGNTEYKVKPFSVTFNRATPANAESNGQDTIDSQIGEPEPKQKSFNPFAK